MLNIVYFCLGFFFLRALVTFGYICRNAGVGYPRTVKVTDGSDLITLIISIIIIIWTIVILRGV